MFKNIGRNIFCFSVNQDHPPQDAYIIAIQYLYILTYNLCIAYLLFIIKFLIYSSQQYRINDFLAFCKNLKNNLIKNVTFSKSYIASQQVSAMLTTNLFFLITLPSKSPEMIFLLDYVTMSLFRRWVESPELKLPCYHGLTGRLY